MYHHAQAQLLPISQATVDIMALYTQPSLTTIEDPFCLCHFVSVLSALVL